MFWPSTTNRMEEKAARRTINPRKEKIKRSVVMDGGIWNLEASRKAENEPCMGSQLKGTMNLF